MVRRRSRRSVADSGLYRLIEVDVSEWPGRCDGERFRAYLDAWHEEFELEKKLQRGNAVELIRTKWQARRQHQFHQCNLCRPA